MLVMASMALALRQLAAEQVRGRSVREVLRATLAMEVEHGRGRLPDGTAGRPDPAGVPASSP
ncbi:MAG: hypothetical protein E6J01_12535 [Chloroflexi bacterium]|nr:MAG: hypothetical protein E6J01_12535 [Chloroflexota bacterium]